MADISNYTRIYNGKIIIPNAFKTPEWVTELLNNIKEETLKNYKLNNNKLDPLFIKKVFEEKILANKVKVNYPLHKKNVSKMFNDMAKVFDDPEFSWRYMIAYQYSFFLSTFIPKSFEPKTLELPEVFQKKKDKIKLDYHKKLSEAKTPEDKDKAIIWVNKELNKLADEVIDYFTEQDIDVMDIYHSGTKGSRDDIRKLLVAVGLSINANGDINDVILNSHAEGLKPTQFFNYSSQGIVSQFHKSHSTAIPGYLVRKLYTVLESLTLSEIEDCRTQKLFEFKIQDKEILERLNFRIYKDTKNGNFKEFNFNDLSKSEMAKLEQKYVGKTIYLRSPLYCQAKDGICKTCMGPKYIDELELKPGDNLGLRLIGAFSEALANSALKSAHAGLSLDKSEIDLTKDIYKYSH